MSRFLPKPGFYRSYCSNQMKLHLWLLEPMSFGLKSSAPTGNWICWEEEREKYLSIIIESKDDRNPKITSSSSSSSKYYLAWLSESPRELEWGADLIPPRRKWRDYFVASLKDVSRKPFHCAFSKLWFGRKRIIWSFFTSNWKWIRSRNKT